MKMLWVMIEVLLLLLVFLGPAAAGEVFTWTDGEGNIHITDRPPKDGAQIENVIHYSNPSETKIPPEPETKQDSAETLQAAHLNKQLKRLKERKIELEKIIDENKDSIAAAEKDAAYYHKRSGSYARRNEKTAMLQLGVLNNNLTTYLSDLRYVMEDISEIEKIE